MKRRRSARMESTLTRRRPALRTPFRLRLAALALASLAPACGSSAPSLAPTARTRTFATREDAAAAPLGPNDIVRVAVGRHPELGAAATRIDDEGNLALPLVGSVHVGGSSVSQARETIAAALSKFVRDPVVELSVVEHGARRFYVFGEVARPGAVVIDRSTNVLQGLAVAGGFTPKANRSRVVLLRGTPEDLEVEVIDASSPTRGGFVVLRDGDVVFVRRSHAGKFSDEILPYLQGISSSLSSAATVLLIEDRIDD
jgi:polysaccharide export outer membrane protein